MSHLAHEVGDDPVEGGALESEALLAGAEGAEVLRGLGHHVSAQLNRTQIEESFLIVDQQWILETDIILVPFKLVPICSCM